MIIHIHYGYSKHKPDDDDQCLYCGVKSEVMAYTYFGAAVCKSCWDTQWRKTEDGATDPAFDEIDREVSGEWVNLPDGDGQP